MSNPVVVSVPRSAPKPSNEINPVHKDGINIIENGHTEAPSASQGNIQDSGNRRKFESGAVRDIQEGKGRCDLMPLDVISHCYAEVGDRDCEIASNIFELLNDFIESGDIECLYDVLDAEKPYDDYDVMFLEVAKHFEDGAKKYGENNWQKGIPVRCYIDSAIRHYLKYLRGDIDEPHDRAFIWNIMCAIWTCAHKPELNEYRKIEG